MSDNVQVLFHLPKETKKQLEELARDDDRSVSSWLRSVIRQKWLDKKLERDTVYHGEGTA